MMPAARAAKIICCLGISSVSSVGSIPDSSAKSSPPMSIAAVRSPAPHPGRGLGDELARVVLLVGGDAVLQVEQDAVRAARVRLLHVFLDVHRHIQQRAPHREPGLHSCSPLAAASIPPSQATPAPRSFAYAPSSTPTSARRSRLCSPSLGAGARIAPGVPENRGTTWCMGNAPMSGSG